VLSLSIGVVCCVFLTVAVLFARLAASRPASRARTFLRVAAGLGSAFLLVKGFELGVEIESGYLPRTSTFWAVYHLLSSVHALLVLVAIVVTLVLAGFGSHRSVETANRFPRRASAAVRYWQFVWLVWMFLFAALYLLR
jgi:nitric oxide reductase NorE protein